MQRITAERLLETVFMDNDGTVLDPAITPYVLMPDPKPTPGGEPCQLLLLTRGEFGYCPTEVELASRSEAQQACDAFNLQLGFSREEADRIILASMGGGTA